MMDRYDVVVVGGGIGGSVAARLLAKEGCRTLLIEKSQTPRNRLCSGIQFPYLEKLVGEKIPREKLCKNELFKVEMITPRGQTQYLQRRSGIRSFDKVALGESQPPLSP